MAFKFDFGECGRWSVRSGCQSLNFFTAAGDDFLSVAFQKDLSYELGFEGFGIWEVPWRVEGFRKSEVLLRYDSSGYSLFKRELSYVKTWRRHGVPFTYRAKNSIHELVHVFWFHKVSTLKHTHREFWDNRQVLLKGQTDLLTELVIILQGLDLSHTPHALECLVI